MCIIKIVNKIKQDAYERILFYLYYFSYFSIYELLRLEMFRV